MYNDFISLYDIIKRKNNSSDDSIIVENKFVVESFNELLNGNDYKFNQLLQLMESNVSLYEQYADNINGLLNECDEKKIYTKSYKDRIINNIIPYCSNIVEESAACLTDKEFGERFINEAYKNHTADRILFNNDKLNKYCYGIVINNNKPLEKIVAEYVTRLDASDINTRKKYFIAVEDLSYRLDLAQYNYNPKELVYELAYLYQLQGLTEYDRNSVNELLCIGESEEFADSNDVKKLIDKYNKQTNKDVSGIKKIIETVFGKNPTQVIDEVPSIFKLLRSCLIIGSFAVSPITGLVTLMADKWISMTVTRNQCDRMYKIFKKEKEKVDDKSFYSDSKKLVSYSKCLDQAMDKIEEHRKSLYTEDELERKDEIAESTSGVLIKDFLIYKINIQKDYLRKYKMLDELTSKAKIQATPASVDIMELFSNSDETMLGSFIDYNGRLRIPILNIRLFDDVDEESDVTFVSHICDELSDEQSIITYTMCGDDNSKLFKLEYVFLPRILFSSEKEENMANEQVHVSDMEDILTIYEISQLLESDILFKIYDVVKENFDKIANEAIDASSFISAGLHDVLYEDYKYLLEDKGSSKPGLFIETQLTWASGILEDTTNDYNLNAVNTLRLQTEAATILENYLTEKVNMASLKMAAMNLNSKAKELSQKEKEASRKFDIVFSQFQKNIERALTTDKRESIIKGSVIPSASKCVKTAILTGAAFLVNPALAVIGALGSLAISKKLTEKERRMLMDEIEVELKFVEKEISNAESEGNSKKYKQLLMYQRRLQREQQRIFYNIKVAGGRIYDPGKKED